MMTILKKKNMSAAEKVRLVEVQNQIQASKSLSEETSSRRNIILLSLFHQLQKLLVYITLYRGVLPKFESYIKLFQKEEPLLHTQHQRMFQLTREFLVLFMKPEEVPQHSVRRLLRVSTHDEKLQVSRRNLFVGKFCFSELQKVRQEKAKHTWLDAFYVELREGYQAAAKYLLEKLPLNNEALKLVSSLDPELRKMETTFTGLENLARLVPNVVSSEESGVLHDELRTYVADPAVNHLAQLYSDKKKMASKNSEISSPRLDTDWWCVIAKMNEYPVLSRLALACMTIFSGPLVEGSFNIMDDIITDDRASLAVENYDALAHVKYTLRAAGSKSDTMIVTAHMKKRCNAAHKTYKEHIRQVKAKAALERQARIDTAMRNLKYNKAKQIKKRMPKKSGNSHDAGVAANARRTAPIPKRSASSTSASRRTPIPKKSAASTSDQIIAGISSTAPSSAVTSTFSAQPVQVATVTATSHPPTVVPESQKTSSVPKRKCSGSLTSWVISTVTKKRK